MLLPHGSKITCRYGSITAIYTDLMILFDQVKAYIIVITSLNTLAQALLLNKRKTKRSLTVIYKT